MSDTDIGIPGQTTQSDLTWLNVAIGLAFIIFDIGVSTVFRLGAGVSLLVAALRCIGQLAAVATILQQVFDNKNPWTVALISVVLNFLGTFETVVNKSSRRFQHMFPVVLIAMLGSTIPISIIGARFAMGETPFWVPVQYKPVSTWNRQWYLFNYSVFGLYPHGTAITSSSVTQGAYIFVVPIVGMLCGATVSGIVISVGFILKELQENKDKVEIYLAFGATRMEACRPIVIQALKLALTPPINQMSVIGIIAIPGMMTGALLGGASVQQAAKLQMIIMFMITASTTLGSVFTTLAAVFVVVDEQHRVRAERITGKSGGWLNMKQLSFKKILGWIKARVRPEPKTPVSDEEAERLLIALSPI